MIPPHRHNLYWQLFLAVVAMGLIGAVLTYEPEDQRAVIIEQQIADLCATNTGELIPVAGGIVVEGVVGAPRYLNPLLSDSNPIDRELVALLFDGLTRYDEQGQLIPALAESWSVSEDGLTIRFLLHDDRTWHDGQPVTAVDVAFTYGLLQAVDFPGSPALSALWQTVTISTEGEREVIFTLSEPYAPFLEATTRGILPAHLLAGVTAVDLPQHAFNQAPVGNGPFMVADGSNWLRDGRLQLQPHVTRWSRPLQLDGLEFRFYPDTATLMTAYHRGEIHAFTHVPSADLPEIAGLPAVQLVTTPAQRYTQLLFNLGENGRVPIGELAVREALAFALDREALLDATIYGQGLPFDGPYLPNSWAYDPALLPLYETRPLSATALLDANGWLLPPNETIRQSYSLTMPLSLRLLTIDLPPLPQIAQILARQWSAVGIDIEPIILPSTNFVAALDSEAFDIALVEISPPRDPDLYDFWSQEAIIRGQNYAGWNNRRASEALEAARQTYDVAERVTHYETFLRLYGRSLPALTLYQHTNTYGLSNTVQGATIGPITQPLDRYATLAEWFLYARPAEEVCTSIGS